MSLTEKLAEQHARIAVLKASEAELTQGPDAALALLGPPTDPIRMHATLGILIRAGRHQQAADILVDQRPDEKWIHFAAFLYAYLGQLDKARSMVDRADNSSDPAVMRLVHLGFAEGVIDFWRNREPNKALLETRPWSKPDTDLAKTTLEILDPLLSLVCANQRIDGEFELGAVTYAAYCAHIADDDRLLTRCGNWLVRYTPLPLIAAELCLRNLIEESPEGLPTRLRLENPGNFQAGILASLVERDLLGNVNEAFDSLLKLGDAAKTDAHKDALCGALFETSGGCDPARIEKAAELIKKLRPDDNRLYGFVQAIKHLVEENAAAAKADLDAIRDEADGRWWQLYAQLCQQNDDEDSAQYAWAKASELLPHPDIVRRSVKASLDRKKYASAIDGLLKLLEIDPTNAQHLNATACSYFQMGDLAQARNYFSRLVNAAPNNVEYRMKFAHCLARLAQVSEAIEILEPVCSQEDLPLAAIFFQSELLMTDNRPADAFRLLEPIAADHWDDPRFLLIYMHQGHASGNDEPAHQAFARLLELRRQGKVPRELMQEGTLEQILEYGKDYERRREALHQGVVLGQIPWLFAEALLQHPATWAWELHTQELKWVSEEPLNRAALSIYATNGFTIHPTAEGRKLEPIIAPSPGTEVVADLSALLTLHKLNRLKQAAEYFGRIILPMFYGDLRIREADKFGLHQPSRETELQKIRTAIDHGRIHIVENTQQDFRLVDEYLDAEEHHVYRLQDLASQLLEAQKICSDDIARLRLVAHQPPAADDTHPALHVGEAVVIDLMTLRTLSNQSVFESVLECFNVHLRASQRDALVSELNAHERARAVRDAHHSLWNEIAKLEATGHIEWHSVAPDPDGGDENSPPSVYLHSAQLAIQLKKPLLADDRVLQVLTYQRMPASPSQAFDSASLLSALYDSGACTLQELASNIHRLMKWRYRFILPSPELLTQWASESIANPPGSKLLDVAAYLHDCLSDPGLHCGSEQSDPPMPMAAKYVDSWLEVIARFLRRVWTDDKFSDDRCIQLTHWVGEELVPSCPRGLWYQPIGNNIAQVERKALFGMVLVHFVGVPNPDRANLGLRTFAEALGLRDEQYLPVAIDGILASTDKEEAKGEHAPEYRDLSLVMMRNAILHLADSGLDPVSFSRLRALDLLPEVPPPSLPSNIAEILRSPSTPTRARVPAGPLLFVPEGQTLTVLEVAPLLLHPDQPLRDAAIAYLQTSTSLPRPWLTDETLNFLSKHEDAIRAEAEEQWREAAIQVVNAVRKDLFALLAGFRQSVVCSYQEGIDQYLEAILHPAFETLANLRPPLWSPTEQRDEIANSIAELASRPELDVALTEYLIRWGYVPLCAQLSAPQVAKSWLEKHPDTQFGWDRLWEWAKKMPTPIAKYHALTVALHVPSMRPQATLEEFWGHFADALDLHDGASNSWHVFCGLASHFARHIEALHPGQHGERIACYAWWLADKVGRLIGTDESGAKNFEEEILTQALQFSYFRWTFSRSPVVPSSFRHATLHTTSVWTLSLLVQLSCAAKSFPANAVPERLRPRVSNVLHGYLMTSNLADASDALARTFAFEENSALDDLCAAEGFVSEDKRTALAQLIQFRRDLARPDELQVRLDRFQELPNYEQHATLLVLNEVLHASAKYDNIIETWLNQRKQVIEILRDGSDYLLELLLEILAEFQQHPMTPWVIRLPHLLAYVIEQSEPSPRVSSLSTAVLQMSVNGGVTSPILRLVSSNKWTDWSVTLAKWHENLAEVAKYSEPWIAARIRAVSAIVSRLIGPRRSKES